MGDAGAVGDEAGEGGDALSLLHIDAGACMGSGNCEFWAPATFDLGDDGVARVVDRRGDAPDRVRSAVQNCPTGAIIIARHGESV